MRRKCFTLVELLVVIGIIAVLMGILLPALSAVKATAQRVVCGANLAGIGKAMLIYAEDEEGDYPRSSSGTVPPATVRTRWGTDGVISIWTDQSGMQYGTGKVTVTSSLYLLIKYAETTPGQFVCKGDAGTRELKLSDAPGINTTECDDVVKAWDFGGEDDAPTTYRPGMYNSYAYHMPYENQTAGTSFGLGSWSNPASPVCADRNPYLDKNASVYLEGNQGCEGGDPDEEPPSFETTGGYKDDERTGNSAAHQREGQNVLFNDTHVKFCRFPNVGITNDNIWKCWPTQAPPATAELRELGQSPYCSVLPVDGDGKGAPMAYEDAYLVSETNKAPSN